MLSEIIARLHAPTPLFWRKLRRFGTRCAAAGTVLLVPLVVPEAAPAHLLTVAQWLGVAGSYIIAAGAVIVAVASLACDDDTTNQTPADQ